MKNENSENNDSWGFVRRSPWLTIVVGHFGVGKTNFCLNLVEHLSAQETRPALTLVDLDIINPYFRSSEAADLLEERGVRVLGPVHARFTLDTPSLSPGIDDTLREASKERLVVVDVGGDPDGARALARFAAAIRGRTYRMLYLANFKRPEVATPLMSLTVLRQIEEQSHLRVSGLVGNTHLKQSTEVDDIIAGLDGLQMLAELTDLPIIGITAPALLADTVRAALGRKGNSFGQVVIPLQTLVGSPWEVEV